MLIKAFGWKKFFTKETKVILDVVNKFYDVKYHLVDQYVRLKARKSTSAPMRLMNCMICPMMRTILP